MLDVRGFFQKKYRWKKPWLGPHRQKTADSRVLKAYSRPEKCQPTPYLVLLITGKPSSRKSKMSWLKRESECIYYSQSRVNSYVWVAVGGGRVLVVRPHQ
jgi:hypothetical protein